MRVIKYRHAYLAGASTLCARHAQDPPASVPALGPVSIGEHTGVCDVCADREARIRDGRAAISGPPASEGATHGGEDPEEKGENDMTTYYAIIPSRGRYGSGSKVYSVYGTADRERAVRKAKRFTAEHQREMARHGGTSGGYRVVETDELCRSGSVVAEFGHDADRMDTVE